MTGRADWSRLTAWLGERTENVVVIPWADLDDIVGGLPESATKHHPQWWHGDRPNTRAWRRAGYELERVELGRAVTLRKSTQPPQPSQRPTARGADGAPPAPESTERSRAQNSGATVPEQIDPSSALILIPCSGDKARGGSVSSGPTMPWAPDLELARARLQAAAGIDERHLMPAWQRYTGAFYQSAGTSLRDAVAEGAHIAILSGGYGVVRADDPIGTYNKMLRLADWPGGVLEEALLSEAVRVGAHHVVAFTAATTDYARLVRRTPWRRAGVARAVLVTIASTGGGAMVKVPRALGAAFRAFWRGEPEAYPPGTQVEELR